MSHVGILAIAAVLFVLVVIALVAIDPDRLTDDDL